jgi:cell division protein FtsB
MDIQVYCQILGKRELENQAEILSLTAKNLQLEEKIKALEATQKKPRKPRTK